MTRAGAFALALLATLAVPAAASARTVAAPETITHRADLGGGPVRAAAPFDFLGVQWRGPREGVAVRLRRAGRWGAWRALHAGDVHRPGRHASDLLPAGGATAYQVRLPAGARDGRASAITVPADARARASAPAPPAGLPVRHCTRTRAQWGADESLRFAPDGTEIWPPAYFPVQKLTVHHTVTEGGAAGAGDPAAIVRAIHRYHAVELGFGDIGYQLLVDANGCIYEGRHSGADDVPVYAARTADGSTPLAVNAGHTAGYNAGNVGVALLGDFTGQQPTARARAGLVRALAALARTSGLDPLGSGLYVNPINGFTKDVPTITGHRDWLATECPGEELYPLLPDIRRAVAGLVAS